MISYVWNDCLRTQRIMVAQLASDSSESEFDESFSDQEPSDYDVSQNHDVEGAVRPYMYELEVEIWDDIVHEIPGIHNNQDGVEERLGNYNW